MISRGVILAAGLGARLSPITPFIPKELLPICGFPAIHHALFELTEAGITEVMIVLSRRKSSLAEYLTEELSPKGESACCLSAQRKALLSKVHLTYAVQECLCGTADAIYLAKDFMVEDPIVVVYPDDLLTVAGRFADGVLATRALVRDSERTGCSILLTEEIAGEQAGSYGVLTLSEAAERLVVDEIVEKPQNYTEDRAYALIGRMVLTPEVIRAIPSFERTDAGGIIPVLRRESASGRLLAVPYAGRRYDVGSHEGYERILRELT